MPCSTRTVSEPELLLHPSDTRTGLRYSLLPMTRSIIAGLFTEEQAQHHLRLIREHLLFPDGVRLMDRPVAYHGGLEQVFRRAEFGGVLRARDRPHVRSRPPSLRRGDGGAGRGRCAVGGAAGGEPDQPSPSVSRTPRPASATPISAAATPPSPTVTGRAPNGRASRRARSRSTAAGASTRAARVSTRTCCSRHAFGIRRRFGERMVEPVLPRSLGRVTLEMVIDGRHDRWDLSAT